MKEATKVSKEMDLNYLIGFAGAALIGIGLAFILYRWNFGGGLSGDSGDWGTFGDYFGGVLNPFLSFLSFLALLITIHLQSNELRLSRQELELTRGELERSADALNNQNKSIAKENFEATFFRLLSKFDDVVSEVVCSGSSGKAAIRELYISRIQNRVISDGEGVSNFEDVRKTYEECYGAQEHILAPYFRTLYHVFRFIDQSDFSASEKSMYANIARAQLNSFDLAFLFFNCIFNAEGRAGFKPLVERYGLLKHLNDTQLPRGSNTFRHEYQSSAFESFAERIAGASGW